MKKQLFCGILSLTFLTTNTYAISDVAAADKYFIANNLSGLNRLRLQNPSNRPIAYLYSKAILNKNSPEVAEQFISNNTNDYMYIDTLHQLLNFYYTSRNYSNYNRIFKLLPASQTSMNEKCGNDLATQTITVDTKYLASNNLPTWCAGLLAYGYLQGNVHKDQRNLMLYNLITYNKTYIFNQIAPSLGLKPLNFAHYTNMPAGKIPANDYLVIERITAIAHNNPDNALNELNKADVSGNANAFLNNYIAMQYAQKHSFKEAIQLYEKYGNNLSDEEYEWLARSYLHNGSWKNLINTIDNMPKSLSSKNVWLYWMAKSYDSLDKPGKADEYFKQIPNDYSYYSMLANSEVGNFTTYKSTPPKNIILDNSDNAKAARIGYDLYLEGKNNNLKHLSTLGSLQWNYTAKNIDDDNLLLAMSNLAKQAGFYDLSIYAANQMDDRYIELSFPLPYWAEYSKYSKIAGIDRSYSLAITRQESRFNSRAVAFDGGIGLMQIMPQTALYISRKSGYKNCYKEGAECNIKFGTWYLGNIYSKFGNLIYATAAYNAGPNRARRWQDSLGSLDNKIQIELIPISITHDYVQKVISNKAVYDNELAGSNKVDLVTYISKIGKQRYLNVPNDDNTDINKLK